MIQQRLERMIARRATLLGVGPMSVNCVDATVELANQYEVMLMLIASRRQVDSKEFSGGYVNNWSTENFAEYIMDRDKKGKIILARDHGGPWQNPLEVGKNMSLRRAMESAKASYAADLEAGFQILHIDPSIDIHGQPNLDEVLDRIFELYEYCSNYAQRLGREVLFEIGTEEQNGSTNKMEELEYILNAMQHFCKKNKLSFPLFVVIQTGTRVMETRNIGSFDLQIRVADEIPPEIQIPKMVELCKRYDIYMKVHNTDYLSNEAIKWFPRLGIHAANVAPEFGVAETKALVGLLENNGLSALVERFLQLSYESGKWKKWMIKDSIASDREKAIIAGHYIFASPECVDILAEASGILHNKGINLSDYLKEQVKISILRYLHYFNLLRAL
jgi:tagatose-1,6-bisphosphate aldolase non-catalytic subunit AgaZ/GatZ